MEPGRPSHTPRMDHGGPRRAGDCFFRALADSWHWTCKNTKIDSTKATHEGAWLRSQACQHIIKHKERFFNFYAVQKKATTKSFETWVAEAAQSTTWTDGLLIQALTEKIGCATIVWRRTASHWERFCFARPQIPQWRSSIWKQRSASLCYPKG